MSAFKGVLAVAGGVLMMLGVTLPWLAADLLGQGGSVSGSQIGMTPAAGFLGLNPLLCAATGFAAIMAGAVVMSEAASVGRRASIVGLVAGVVSLLVSISYVIDLNGTLAGAYGLSLALGFWVTAIGGLLAAVGSALDLRETMPATA